MDFGGWFQDKFRFKEQEKLEKEEKKLELGIFPGRE